MTAAVTRPPVVALPFPEIHTPRLTLCLPEPEAAARMIAFFRDNAAHLEPWSAPRAEGFLDPAFWEARLAAAREGFRSGQALSLVMFARGATQGEAIGTIGLSQIFRGPFQNAYLGYQIGRRHQGEGLMFEGLRAAIAYAFGELCLHRLSANYVPENARSARLLQRLGFTIEGRAKDYLFIGGAWRDHVLTSLTNPEWREFRWV